MDRLNKVLAIVLVFVLLAIAAYLLMLDMFAPDGRGLGGRIGQPWLTKR